MQTGSQPNPGRSGLVKHAQRLGAVVGGAYVAAWVPAIAARLLDLEPALAWSLLVVAVVLGGYAGYRQELHNMDSREQRDAVIGWSIVLAFIGGIVAQLLPVPWNVAAALCWIAIVVAVARALLSPAAPEERATMQPS